MAFTTSDRFDFKTVNAILADLEEKCRAFITGPGAGSLEQTIEYAVEARYPHQIWEIELPLRSGRFATEQDVRQLVADFHRAHKEIFEISDPNSEIEAVTWRARVGCRLRDAAPGRLVESSSQAEIGGTRRVYFAGTGWVEATVARFERIGSEAPVVGPAIVESSFTTVVVDPGAVATRTAAGSLSITV
jgi:N-methylhydantoinase A